VQGPHGPPTSLPAADAVMANHPHSPPRRTVPKALRVRRKSAATLHARYRHLEHIPTSEADWDLTALRIQAGGAARLPSARTPICSRSTPRCAQTPTSARSTTGGGPARPTTSRLVSDDSSPRLA
jgi:hypothetical protein